MDITPEISEPLDALSYDETVPYDELLPTQPSAESSQAQASLAHRIGSTKVYLLSETTGARVGKRKRTADEGDDADGDVDMDEDAPYRDNAILFCGAPISHLPTPSIFAYATHFDSQPMALEWIDDKTCILVFSSKTTARSAFRYLSKSIAEEPSKVDGSVTAKPIPIALWPPEERISKSLGKSEGLKGAIRMRWATFQDVKKKGAKRESEFYKKYGDKAGKSNTEDEVNWPADDDTRQRKKQKGDMFEEMAQKARLDDELDAFLAEDDTTAPRSPSPPSRMRSDYMDGRGRTLLERTSVMRARPDTLASRIMAELPSRARSRRGQRQDDGGGQSSGQSGHRGEDDGTRRGKGNPRPRKTQQDLDDELDAFLNAKD
ncbi:uncharacterized protein FIBRA_01176 [Fibroporia radiculosa]|uniref:Chromatin target of PRMT1 protein C-terminal domain-containing protein n=1 Tax=Fibroporia radiculosa TaxID=599839 RepID=J4I8C3_9APHY|nr:uncharacterized protein FIBRA_01176 [Fibroporia radiculosa]CCL99161.1 predicted protein [Fibroporia radiculosa]